MATLQVTDHFTLQFDSVIIKKMFDLLPESERQNVINHVLEQSRGKAIFLALTPSQAAEMQYFINKEYLKK